MIAATTFTASPAIAVPNIQGTTPIEGLPHLFADPVQSRTGGYAIPAEQKQFLNQLADAPSKCITDRSLKNAASPMFGNCFDWHSDVHAHWALYAVTGHTGDAKWAQASEADLNLGRISAELRYLNGNNVAGHRHENPYGLSWMLRLARERESVTGDNQLRPLATAAVTQIRRTMDGWSASEWRQKIADHHYYNASWPLLNLWEWAQFSGDADLANWVRAKVDAHVKDPALDATLPATRDAADSQRGGFFAPALLRLAVVSMVDQPQNRQWVAERLPNDLVIAPYPNTGAAHANALTFSRAFTLNILGAQLGRSDLTANATELIRWQMARPAVWKWGGDYTNTHWISQMGVLAITAPAGLGVDR